MKVERKLARRIASAALAGLGVLAAAWLPAADKASKREAPAPQVTLRQVADPLGFRIGSIMQVKMFSDPQYREVLGREFNTFFSFAFMRFTEPEANRFDFSGMDRDIQFAREHQMRLFGGSLIYRAGIAAPYWLTQRKFGGFTRSKDELDGILKNYIDTVVRHGGGAYYAWEVVDEPISNPNQPWQFVFGRDEYLARAFRYAHEANPSAALVLNETFGPAGIDRGKADEFFDLIQRLKSRGVPVDVAGTELHLEAQQLHRGYLDELRYFLSRARALGVQAYITEMDVYQGPSGAFPNPMEHQRQIYHDVLATCLADSNCKTLIVWGISDVHTWIREKRNNPHPDAEPLLFDAQWQKKPAYFGVLQALQQRAGTLSSASGAKRSGE